MVNLKELTRELSEMHPDIPIHTLDQLTSDFVKVIEDSLASMEKVKLHKTLTLEPKVLQAKRAYNGVNREYFDKEESYTVRVKVHRQLYNRLNKERG